MYQTTDFRKGLKIELEGKPYLIVEFQHVNPGKGSAFVRTRLKNLETNQVIEKTFKAGVETAGRPDMEEREMELLGTLSKTLSGMLDRIKAGQAASAEADGKTR